ncbi:MAG: Gfo/Idh/MocA family oxidoreductase [Phycisphaeraceae bacterium]
MTAIPDEWSPGPPIDQPLNLGVVGCGWVAKAAHLPAIALLQAHGWPIRVGAVCDTDAARRAAAAERFDDARQCENIDALLATGVDAVLALAPPSACPALCRACMDAERPVLVEKPVSYDAGELTRLAGEVEQRGAVVEVAYNRRHQPGLARLREAGALDWPIDHVLARMWRVNRRQEDFYPGTIVHVVDLLLHLFGPMEVAEVHTGPLLSGTSIASWVRAELRAGAGAGAGGEVTLDVRPTAGRELETLEFVGDGHAATIAYALAGWDGPVAEAYADGRPQLALSKRGDDGGGDVYLRGFVNQLAAFAHRVRHAAGPTCTVRDALHTRQLCDALVPPPSP